MLNPKILIVEDSPLQALQLQTIIEENGYQCEIAENGIEALSLLDTKSFDIIISDIIMPEMDGFELCKKVKHDIKYKHIPVFLLTSLSNSDDIIMALDSGADRFFTKPYNDDVIISSIRDATLNKDLRRDRTLQMGVKIFLSGKDYFITSEKFQIIDLLFSTYENAVLKNRELDQANRELKFSQQALNEKNIELKKLNEQKNHFLGVASHDLKNSLNAVIAFSDLISKNTDGNLTKKQEDFIQLIKSSGKYMLDLVNDLLDVSVIESEGMRIKSKKGNLKDLVYERVKINEILAQKKEIDIIAFLEETSDIYFDALRMSQAIDNLLSNAMKYSQTGSKIFVDLVQEENNIKIIVTDEGMGISEEDIPKLFKPFPMLDIVPTGGERSTGLGLSITKKIIEAHKGSITVESHVGMGSKFIISLPVQNY
ncbi:MAG: hybrid sensor histidine kinase/response regulator [Desulfobacterales bacterium]|nr:hybrid sensor histidine kinase/response regulator [Desulfobacterales bacterium]